MGRVTITPSFLKIAPVYSCCSSIIMNGSTSLWVPIWRIICIVILFMELFLFASHCTIKFHLILVQLDQVCKPLYDPQFTEEPAFKPK